MARRTQAQLLQSYREHALKMFPWIGAHCGRAWAGKTLSQLTVHHKDHHHDHHPPDGSNGEWRGLYGHDNAHRRHQVAAASGEALPSQEQNRPSPVTPFAPLADLIKCTT